MQVLSDEQLLRNSKTQQANANCDADLKMILPGAFAMVREASRRAHRQAHYEVQLLAGIGLTSGRVAEMQTGEGKTLAALLPAFLYSLLGQGVHVITANDYLAQRDAKFASAVFQRLGISVGCVFDGLPRHMRQANYDCEITYGTAREFGFDFLKDRLENTCSSTICSAINAQPGFRPGVQRGHHFALVDEADSVMIDDARTPLLIANAGIEDPVKQDMIRACHDACLQLRQSAEFELEPNKCSATLTKLGCLNVLRLVNPKFVHGFGPDEIYRQIENSLTANYLFLHNRHYVLNEGKVAIVDESTGRFADGRKWQNGLHQAIEAKESVAITTGTQTMARVTVQSYFRKYQRLAGLTGTAHQVAHEFNRVYGLGVIKIPSRKPLKRTGFPTRIFSRFKDKANAVAIATKKQLDIGQAVLIGTPSVQASRSISQTLTEYGIKHHVLNCLEHEKESKIIEHAGLAGSVTVATNMAGPWKPIFRVDPTVQQNGGLHIIATAKNASTRIDHQLIGRTARQGKIGIVPIYSFPGRRTLSRMPQKTECQFERQF